MLRVAFRPQLKLCFCCLLTSVGYCSATRQCFSVQIRGQLTILDSWAISHTNLLVDSPWKALFKAPKWWGVSQVGKLPHIHTIPYHTSHHHNQAALKRSTQYSGQVVQPSSNSWKNTTDFCIELSFFALTGIHNYVILYAKTSKHLKLLVSINGRQSHILDPTVVALDTRHASLQ